MLKGVSTVDQGAEPQVSHTVLDIGYDPHPVFLDRRGTVAGGLHGNPLFTSANVALDHVVFDHPQRMLRIDIQHTFLFAAGAAEWDALLDKAFLIMSAAGVQRVRATRLTRFYAIAAEGHTLSDLVTEHSEAIGPLLDPRPYATLEDVGTIFSIDLAGRKVNFQFGPMGRNQWTQLGGPKMAPVEATLPAVAWGVGIYDREPAQVALDVKGARRSIEKTLESWGTFVQRTVSVTV